MFRRLLAAWGTQHHQPARPARRLRLEPLEGREVPTVSLAPIPDQPTTNNVPQFLPVTVSNTPNGPVTYTVSSDNPAVTPSVVLGGRSLRLSVTGRNPDGTDFSGDLVIRLFEDTAPQATARIIQLANQGFYNGKLFHRVSGQFTGPTDTIIQGGSLNGDGTGGSGLGNLSDEYSPDVRFNSPGIVASANAGDDTTDSQFFVVRPSTPLDRRPQFLNYNFTVLGILTAGADVYERINATPLSGSRPVSNVTITSATVFADPNNAVVRVNTQPGFAGTARLTVTPSDADGVSAPVSATLTGTTANPPQGNPPFLGPLPTNLTTTAGQPVTFSVPFTDVDGSPVTFDVRDAGFTAAPANVSVSVNQPAGTVTLTPAAGFTGTVNLRVGVRDDTDRSGTGNPNVASNFDTQALTLTVSPDTPVPAATVTLAATPAAADIGQAVSLTASISAAGVANLAGTVEFRNGSALLATAPVVNAAATTVLTFPAAGSQSLTARFVPADATVVAEGTSVPLAFVVSPTVPTAVTPTVSLAVTPTSVGTGQSVSLTATVTAAGVTPAGTVQFFAGGTLLASAGVTGGQAVATASFAAAGSQSLTAVFAPTDPAVLTGASSPAVSVTVTGAVPPPPTAGVTALGSRRGELPRVSVRNADGGERVSILAFEQSFTGGVRTAVADVTGDGVPDIVVVPGFGGGPVVKVFDSTTGELIASKFVMDENFRGGLTLATGDTGDLGYSRVAVGAGETGAPRVVLYDFRQNATVRDFFAYDDTLRGGVSVAMAVLPGGTGADLVTGVGAGGGPRVNVYDGATGTLLGSRFYGDETRRDGIGVRVGDDFGSPAIFVNRYMPDGTTAQDPIDTGFVNFNAGVAAAQQTQIEGLLNPGGSGGA